MKILPNEVGEVARRAGGVRSIRTVAYDPSVRFADTSPAKLGRTTDLLDGGGGQINIARRRFR
jgi:hypothetical protein